MFSNARRVLSQCNTRLRLLYLLNKSDFSRLFAIKGCNGNDAVNTTYGYLDWYRNTGFVRSTNYPANYLNNQDCRWFIKVAPGYRIRVTVEKADIAHATHVGSLGDSLQVDDGRSSTNSHEMSLPWTFLSAGNLVRVRFETDSQDTGKGFYLRYERGIEIFGVLSLVVIPCEVVHVLGMSDSVELSIVYQRGLCCVCVWYNNTPITPTKPG